MVSEAKLAANRANAQLSTGPTSPDGKAAVAGNAIRHGILSRVPVIPGEEIADWEGHRAGIVESLRPVGTLEVTLAEQAALLLWRMGRLVRYEALATAAAIEGVDVPAPVYEGEVSFDTDAFTGRRKETPAERGTREAREARWSRVERLLLADDKQQKVVRYEAHLSRHLQVTLDRLRILQADRGGGGGPPPATRIVSVGLSGCRDGDG